MWAGANESVVWVGANVKVVQAVKAPTLVQAESMQNATVGQPLACAGVKMGDGPFRVGTSVLV